MFFARPNEYEPCGIFTTKHFILIILTFNSKAFKTFELKAIYGC